MPWVCTELRISLHLQLALSENVGLIFPMIASHFSKRECQRDLGENQPDQLSLERLLAQAPDSRKRQLGARDVSLITRLLA